LTPVRTAAAPTADARTRIVQTAYELFSRHGIRAVGIDRIIAEAGVAKMTLYRHFVSKDALVVEFLAVREQVWTRDWLEAETERRAKSPEARLLALFDVFDEWFRRPDYEGCAFIRTVMEFHDPAAPAYQEAVRRLENVRLLVEGWVRQAGVPARDAESLSYQFQILMMGAIVSATRGDRAAARRAQSAGALLLQTAL
jgi:AcrR family transcriptional regulator